VLDLSYDKKEHVMELVERLSPDRKTSVLVGIDLTSKQRWREERLRELRTSFPSTERAHGSMFGAHPKLKPFTLKDELKDYDL